MEKKSAAFIPVIVMIAVLALDVSFVSVQGKAEENTRAKIEVEGRYWFPELSGSAKAVSADIGSGVDYKDDLGMGDEGIPEGRITWYP